MKFPFLSIALLFSFAVNAQDVSTANWAVTPITIDGIANEWHQPLNLYDSETKLLFAMKNDSTHIYLCFESKDDQTQRKIMRAGMSVELDFKGKTKRSATITYPLPPKEREEGGEVATDNSDKDISTGASREEQESIRRQRQQLVRQQFLTDNLTMELIGFASANGLVPIRGRDITAAMNWDSTGNLFYEIAIPIKQLIDDGYTVDAIKKEITLQVRVMSLPQKERHFTDARIIAAAPQDGGGNGANSFGGGRHSSGSATSGIPDRDRQGLYKTTYFKQKFVLAAVSAGTSTL